MLCYVRATSREEYIFQSGTHAVKSYWLWSQAMAGCSQGGIPWGFPPPAPPHRPQPFFAPVSCSNSVFICIWPPWKRHIPPEKYIPHEMLCGHSADIYLRGYMSALNPSSVFGSGPKLARLQFVNTETCATVEKLTVYNNAQSLKRSRASTKIILHTNTVIPLHFHLAVLRTGQVLYSTSESRFVSIGNLPS